MILHRERTNHKFHSSINRSSLTNGEHYRNYRTAAEQEPNEKH